MKTVTWPQIWGALALKRDKTGRWYPTDDTPEIVVDYCNQYRSPSRAWPQSYAKTILTAKFAKHVITNAPELAQKLNLID